MNPLSPTDLQQMIAKTTLIAADMNAPMIGSRNKSRIKKSPRSKKLPSVATVLRKTVQEYLEAGAINPKLPFSREDMLVLLEEEQKEAQLPSEVFAIYYDAVVSYPLGCLWIYLNWNKRPNPTKLGNLFRSITLDDVVPYMCYELNGRLPGVLAEAGLKEIERLLKRCHSTPSSIEAYYNSIYNHNEDGEWLEEEIYSILTMTIAHKNHFYDNWELFSKNPRALYYKAGINQ